jgi:hypothetical protein
MRAKYAVRAVPTSSSSGRWWNSSRRNSAASLSSRRQTVRSEGKCTKAHDRYYVAGTHTTQCHTTKSTGDARCRLVWSSLPWLRLAPTRHTHTRSLYTPFGLAGGHGRVNASLAQPSNGDGCATRSARACAPQPVPIGSSDAQQRASRRRACAPAEPRRPLCAGVALAEVPHH